MHKHMLWCSLALLPVMFLGCSKSGNGTTDPPPPPPGVAEVEPNDVDPQYLGALGTADIRVNGGAANSSDVDWYRIVLNGTTNLHASVDWVGGDIDLGLADGNGIMLSYRDTGAKPERCTLPARPAGTYLIRVTSKNTSAVAYTLTIGPR
jgi:hypothetical protein